MAYGWKGTFLELKIKKEEIINSLKKFIQNQGFNNSSMQIEAWDDQIDFLIEFTPTSYSKTLLVFEYVIEEGYIRPDVLIFLKNKIVILEFKMKNSLKIRDALQLNNYRETLSNFHEYTWMNKIELKPYLVLTKDRGEHHSIFDLAILNEINFKNELKKEFNGPMKNEHQDAWINSSFDAIPSLFEASVRLFKEKRLPRIKSVEQGSLKPAYNRIQSIIRGNIGEKNIIFLCGVPGAGKTLLALQTMYKELEMGNKKVAYVSGNTPLLSVLKKYLKEELGVYPKYIEGIFTFLRKSFKEPESNPKNLIIYDEAQRAWDANKMWSKLMPENRRDELSYNDNDQNYRVEEKIAEGSEVFATLNLCNEYFKNESKINLLVVLGPGQEIHLGEEKGMELWVEELAKKEFEDWNIYLPEKYKNHFSKYTAAYPEFFLTSNIRSNTAKVSGLSKGALSINYRNYNDRIYYLKKYIKDMYKKGYFIAFSSEIERCKSIIKELADNGETCGLIGPSHAKYRKMVTHWKKHGKYDRDLEEFNLFEKNLGEIKQVNHKNVTEWFLGESNKFESIATEFHCQGLELDYSIVCMYGDYAISPYRKWKVSEDLMEAKNDKKLDHNKLFNDFEKIVRNRWIVLLTRARKGMVLHIPDNKDMKYTRKFFKDIGVIEI